MANIKKTTTRNDNKLEQQADNKATAPIKAWEKDKTAKADILQRKRNWQNNMKQPLSSYTYPMKATTIKSSTPIQQAIHAAPSQVPHGQQVPAVKSSAAKTSTNSIDFLQDGQACRNDRKQPA